MDVEGNPLSPLSSLKPRIVSCKSVFFDSRGGQDPEEPVQDPEVTITSIPANLSSLTGITVNIKNQSQTPDFNPTIHQLANCKTESVSVKSVESVLQSLKPIPVS